LINSQHHAPGSRRLEKGRGMASLLLEHLTPNQVKERPKERAAFWQKFTPWV
jgi:hypothetical protein